MTPTTPRPSIVDDGVYYFAAGANSHDAINNILAAKQAAGVSMDTSKITGEGNAALVGTYTQEAFDAETITNQFEDVNMKLWIGPGPRASSAAWTETVLFPKVRLPAHK